MKKEQLKLAISLTGWTNAAIAQHLEISIKTLYSYRNGDRNVPDDALEEVNRIVELKERAILTYDRGT